MVALSDLNVAFDDLLLENSSLETLCLPEFTVVALPEEIVLLSAF